MTRKVQQAHSLNIVACDACDGVHVELYNDDGEIFAAAIIPFERCDETILHINMLKNKIQARRSGSEKLN